MTWALIGQLFVISLVWSLGAVIVLDRIVAPDRAGPAGTWLGAFFMAFATTIAVALLMAR